MKRNRRGWTIDINEVGKYYHITEDGAVYSHIRKRWLKPQYNLYGYIFYFLSFGVRPGGVWIFAHTLVALKYIGKPPTERHEIDHLDGNKSNNHYSNLCWRTHSENILESFRRGQRGKNPGRQAGFSHTGETKLKMADAKKKRVEYRHGEGVTVYESIDDASVGLGTYRKKVYLCVKNNTPFRGGYLRYIDDTL